MRYKHPGSYETITGENGNLVEKPSFDPCMPARNKMKAGGRRRNPLDGSYSPSPFSKIFDRGYTGHEHLEIFGLINMNGRVYAPWLGRMLSPDPFVQAPGNSQSYNRYTYVFNNPLKYTDPSGYEGGPYGPPSDYAYGPGAASLGMVSVYYNYNTGQVSWTRTFGNSGFNMPGTGKHWSDQYRSEYGNYMITNSRNFDKLFGKGSADLVRIMRLNPELYEDWKDGKVTLAKIRQKGGFWVDYSKVNDITVDFGNGHLTLQEVEFISKWVAAGSAGGGELANNGITLNETATGVSAIGFSNSVKGYILDWGMQGANWGKTGARYMKVVRGTGVAGSVFGMGVSGYNMYSDYSQGGINAVNGWDVSDFGVGAVGLTTTGLVTLGLVSNPVGWVIVGGVTIYFGARFVYDISTKP